MIRNVNGSPNLAGAQSIPLAAVQATVNSAASSATELIARATSLQASLSDVLRPAAPQNAPQSKPQPVGESPLHEQIIALRSQIDEAIEVIESIRARLTV